VIYGKWSVQASKQANIHMHRCNEVTPLVWARSSLPQLLSCYKMLMSCTERKSVSLFCEIRKPLSMADVLPQQESIADTTL